MTIVFQMWPWLNLSLTKRKSLGTTLPVYVCVTCFFFVHLKCENVKIVLSITFLFYLQKIDPDTKQSLTYSQIVSTTSALATGLQTKYKLQPGDMVAVALPTCLEYSITVLAINLCGATSVLINPSQTIRNK